MSLVIDYRDFSLNVLPIPLVTPVLCDTPPDQQRAVGSFVFLLWRTKKTSSYFFKLNLCKCKHLLTFLYKFSSKCTSIVVSSVVFHRISSFVVFSEHCHLLDPTVSSVYSRHMHRCAFKIFRKKAQLCLFGQNTGNILTAKLWNII